MAHAHAGAKRVSERYCRNERRHIYSTPRSFLEHLRLYQSLLEKRERELQLRHGRLRSGLQKLKTTASQVRGARGNLRVQRWSGRPPQGWVWVGMLLLLVNMPQDEHHDSAKAEGIVNLES